MAVLSVFLALILARLDLSMYTCNCSLRMNKDGRVRTGGRMDGRCKHQSPRSGWAAKTLLLTLNKPNWESLKKNRTKKRKRS